MTRSSPTSASARRRSDSFNNSLRREKRRRRNSEEELRNVRRRLDDATVESANLRATTAIVTFLTIHHQGNLETIAEGPLPLNADSRLFAATSAVAATRGHFTGTYSQARIKAGITTWVEQHFATWTPARREDIIKSARTSRRRR